MPLMLRQTCLFSSLGRLRWPTFCNLHRFQSTFTTADELNTKRLDNLYSLASKEFLDNTTVQPGESATSKAFQILSTCKMFQDSVYKSDRLHPDNNTLIERSNKLIKEILTNKNVEFDDVLLTKLFRLQPEFPTLRAIISAYYSKGLDVYIDADTAMIPFRRLVWDGNFQHALDYVELTTGCERYFKHKRSNIKRYAEYFGGTMVGLIGVMHGAVKLFFPELIQPGAGGAHYGIYGVYAMVVSYFVNCGFLATLSFSSRGMENGALLFKHGTMPWDWYQKVDQMKMCAKVLEADAAIHGAEGFATRDVVSRISGMGFDVNEPEQEVMMRQYWYSSGEGFVWVEPDLDPAEVEWWGHLTDVGVKKFWDPDYTKLEEAPEEQEDGEPDEEDLVLPEK